MNAFKPRRNASIRTTEYMRPNLLELVEDLLDRFRDTDPELEESNSANQDASFKTCASCEKTYFGSELTMCPECDAPLEPAGPDRDRSS
jgi:hypothetical protein